ncbi:MAG: hypothetical protein FWH34_03905, partial [Desulfovibrionaceae bacterium]|nr:hypothetical protein [Desulfovibrionaceae bacterium]
MINEMNLMRRKRMDALLEKAFEKPVVTVVAGPGCGKTCAVSAYLQSGGISTLWVQLSEGDNQPARFWETFIRAVGSEPELRVAADQLRRQEMPANQADLMRTTGLIADEIMPRRRYAIVFDDLHLIQNTAVLWFIRAFAYGLASGRIERFNAGNSIVMISREDCGLNSAALAENRVANIGEQDLNFTKNEALEYFQYIGIKVSMHLDFNAIYSDTEGWPFLLGIVGRLLKTRPDDVKYIRGTLRHNVTKIIEDELFLYNSPELNKFLAKLSLVDRLSADFVSRLEGGDLLIHELTQHSTLIRYDTYTNAYHIHHLVRDFLLARQNLLTEEEKRAVYQAAAQWCMEHDFKMNAAGYFAKAGDYVAIVGIVYRYPQFIPFQKAALLFELLDNAPPGLEAQMPFIQYRARLLLSLGKIDQAMEEMRAKILRAQAREDRPDNRLILMGANYMLGTAMMLTCNDTGDYGFAKYFRKSETYLPGSNYKPIGSMRVATLAPYVIRIGSRKKDEPEKYIQALEETVPSVARIMDGCMYGLDSLACAELAYYRADMAGCKRWAMQTLFKAQEKEQYEIENHALLCLLRVGLAAGKYRPIQDALRQMDNQLEVPGFLNRYIRYDIHTGWFYASIGQKENIPEWLKSDFTVSHAKTVLSNYEDFARAKYYLLEQNYSALLAMLSSRTGGFDITRYLFGQIALEAYRAVCLHSLKDTRGALASLCLAYGLAS